jgi:DNA-3-methyladenine glycosylase I
VPEIVRCSWANSEAMAAYHDSEWGVPSHDDRHLFEMLILEGAQAGLSWSTILNRREGYRKAFDNFDVAKVAAYDDSKKAELLLDPGIIRNRAKIEASVQNAKCVLDVQREFGSFATFLWEFVEGEPLRTPRGPSETPASTPDSDRLSKALKQRGFKFVGTTICYAFMQATGIVIDHEAACFRCGMV